MKILGISGSLLYPENHDTSAALLIDGKLVANYEDERFTGSKHSIDHRFPTTSIRKILTEYNIKRKYFTINESFGRRDGRKIYKRENNTSKK